MDKKLTIIQVDSDDYYHTNLDLILFSSGQEVRARAYNLNGARALIEQIQSGKLKPDLAIIDTLIEIDNEDGGKFAKKLREISPDTKIILYTIVDDEYPWADYVAIKSDRNRERNIIKGLQELFQIQPANNTGKIDLN